MRIKSALLTTLLCLATFSSVFAHAFYIVTNNIGAKGQIQEVRLYYGEYSYNAITAPNSEDYKSFLNYSLFAVAPSGQKIELETAAKEDHFYASFTPSEEGVYTIVVENTETTVLDYTQWDFGIFKPHYYGQTNVFVGNSEKSAPVAEQKYRIEPVEMAPFKVDTERKFRLYVDCKPLADKEVQVAIKKLWSTSPTTDENGEFSVYIPVEGLHVVEVTYKDEKPATYAGKDYEFIWQSGVYTFIAE